VFCDDRVLGYLWGVGEVKMVGMAGRRTVAATAVVMTLVCAVTLGWASASGAFQLDVPNVVINEVHYEPAAGGVEFIELLNPTDADIDISLMEIDAVGEPYVIPSGTTLPAGGTGIFTNSLANFQSQYPNAAPAFTLEYPGSLDPEGELVQLALADGTEVDSAPYLSEDPWPTAPNGTGPSLSLFDPTLDNEFHESWGVSANPGGTPGAANDTIEEPLDPVPNIVINEIHYNPGPTGVEFIELYNLEARQVDISSFDLEILDFPTGTSIAGNGYLVVTASLDKFNAVYPGVPALEWDLTADLDDNGGVLGLTSADGRVVDSVPYGNTDGWPTTPNGSGRSAELENPSLSNEVGSNWNPSARAGGTPGIANGSADSLGPVFAIDSPQEGDVAQPGSVVVAGTAEDSGSGVDSISVVIRESSSLQYWNGVDFQTAWARVDVAVVGGLWAVDVDVVGGEEYRVVVYGRDLVGNLTRSTATTPVRFAA
jgi:hypothetical protein